MIGERLKSARAASELSLRTLSDAMGNVVSAHAISKYERNKCMPRSDVLISLPSALDVSVDFLMSDDAMKFEGVEFSKPVSASEKEEARIKVKTLHRMKKYLAIEGLLNLPSQEWDQPQGTPY